MSVTRYPIRFVIEAVKRRKDTSEYRWIDFACDDRKVNFWYK